MGKSTKTPVSIRLTDAELELRDRIAKQFGGNQTKAFVAGLKALDGKKERSKEELIAEITRRLK